MHSHYRSLEKRLPKENILYLRYANLKNPETRNVELRSLVKFLDMDTKDEKRLNCAFLLADRPETYRNHHDSSSAITKEEAFQPIACQIWNIVGKAAAHYKFKVLKGVSCLSSTGKK